MISSQHNKTGMSKLITDIKQLFPGARVRQRHHVCGDERPECRIISIDKYATDEYIIRHLHDGESFSSTVKFQIGMFEFIDDKDWDD